MVFNNHSKDLSWPTLFMVLPRDMNFMNSDNINV